VDGLGNIYPSRRNGKDTWAWHAQSFEHFQAVIALLWRWLSPIKREQARIALERYHADRVGRRRVVPRGRSRIKHTPGWRQRGES
jgi:hypothetical protein